MWDINHPPKIPLCDFWEDVKLTEHGQGSDYVSSKTSSALQNMRTYFVGGILNRVKEHTGWISRLMLNQQRTGSLGSSLSRLLLFSVLFLMSAHWQSDTLPLTIACVCSWCGKIFKWQHSVFWQIMLMELNLKEETHPVSKFISTAKIKKRSQMTYRELIIWSIMQARKKGLRSWNTRKKRRENFSTGDQYHIQTVPTNKQTNKIIWKSEKPQRQIQPQIMWQKKKDMMRVLTRWDSVGD